MTDHQLMDEFRECLDRLADIRLAHGGRYTGEVEPLLCAMMELWDSMTKDQRLTADMLTDRIIDLEERGPTEADLHLLLTRDYPRSPIADPLMTRTTI